MKKFLAHILTFTLLAFLVLKVVHADAPLSTCGTGKLCNPLSTGDTLVGFLQAIVENIVLPIGAIIAVMAFIFTGFLYVMAQGNESKLQTAHKSLLYTAIGTAFLLGAWTIATVVQKTVIQITTP